MSDRSHRKVTYLTDEEAAQLSEWADVTNKSESQLLREAVTEYLDQDRTARLSEQLDRIESKIDTLPLSSDESVHTHTRDSSDPSPTIKNVRRIEKYLRDNHDEVVDTNTLHTVIGEIAGGDPRTLEKYQSKLKQRNLLFEHPGDNPVWTFKRDMWGRWVDSYCGGDGDRVFDIAEEYGMNSDEIETIAAEAADQ
jgi:hypothetical protein